MPVRLMGVINVTPDSFSDGGRYLDPRAAIARGHEMLAHGADIIDIGGESTRPGAQPVPADIECERVCAVVNSLSSYCQISIDTRKPQVADAAIAAGATILNDVSASLAEVAARHQVGWIAMHMQREPATMQHNPSYTDVVAEVGDYLSVRATAAKALGVPTVWVDPGIGFGKNLDHNMHLLRNLETFTAIGDGVALAVSRKSFIGEILGLPDPTKRLPGALAVSVHAVAHGVAILRTHDVAETLQAVRMAERLLERR